MNRIDVHHHFIPPAYVEAYKDDPSGWKLPSWSVSSTLELMDAHKTKTSILSLTSPGTSILSGTAAAKLARDTNLHASELCKQYPDRLGFFASLPPLDGDLALVLEEMRYALDVLHADGVTLYTRYGEHYLGHSSFTPIWDELDKRAAVVFIHPTHSINPQLVNPSLPQPVIDYPHETTRTAADLITSNTVRTHRSVKIILSHAGGTLPYLATRAAHLLAGTGLSSKPADEFMEDAREFYFDLALSSNEFELPLVLGFAKKGHVLYGSDFPYAPRETIDAHVKMFEAYDFGNTEKEYEVARGAAVKLFPRFRIDGDRD
ncbi:Amidohydrolase [Aspergillus sclerotialis]|uniref:6-methylsalicylate decarboxylase n=1 Tax=Aspergillus sclerotialis TaxID=2070753 RepID=A0A3A2ZLX4_9EURO|nr:Amidohydrolase [Aspergillus sclerotialis]